MVKKLKKWKGLLFVLPSLIGVVIFYIIPFIQSAVYCFTSGSQDKTFIGLNNFKKLFHNDAYHLAAINTIKVIGISVVLLCVLAVFIGMIIEQQLSKYRFIQSFLLIPMAIPTASMVLVWQDVLRRQGILSCLIGRQIEWLDSKAAIVIVIGIIIWKNIGYNVLLIISTLLTIPAEYAQAASLDGAGNIKIALYIKLPQLVPMLFFMFVISLFNANKIFRELYLLKGEYPDEKLYLLQHFMNNNFANLNYNMLTTAAFTMYLIISLIILVLARIQENYITNNLLNY